ncbi:MAG: ABC transporter substrate-binding protein [Ilumatobacteraceae bacterium]
MRIAGLIAAAGLALVACSNSSDDSTADSVATESSQATDTTTADRGPADTEAPTDTEATTETAEPTDTAEPSGTSEPAGDSGPDLGEFAPISGVPGVTDEAIQYAVLGTGPSNPAGYCLLECYLGGVQAYFDYRNSIGGVHGRQLEISHEVDDELANTQVELLELIGSDDVFGTFFAPLIPSGHEDANAARMPIYTLVQGGPEGAGFDNVYIPAIFCADCLRKSVVHQAELLGATRVASLGLGVSQASKDCVAATEQAFDQWGPDVGIEFVYANDTLPFGLTNGLAPEVTAMKEAGVDFVTLCIDQNGALTLEQELNRQGMAEIPVLLPQGYGDTEFVEANAELLEGDVLSLFSRPFEANQEGTLVPEMIEWIDAGGYKMNDQAIQGWINADMAVSGLLAAGPQFDRESVIQATNAITAYDASGLVPTIDWTKQHTRYTGETMLTDGPPVGCTALVRIEGGEFVLIGNPNAPYYAYDSSTMDWTEPTESDCRAS